MTDVKRRRRQENTALRLLKRLTQIEKNITAYQTTVRNTAALNDELANKRRLEAELENLRVNALATKYAWPNGTARMQLNYHVNYVRSNPLHARLSPLGDLIVDRT